jgi:hypothetical protein
MREEPTQALQDYNKSTTGVLGFLKTQLGNLGIWKNIPGALTKISTSSGGYVWGYNFNSAVFVCKEPCNNAEWVNVSTDALQIVTLNDITTDASQVYITYTVEGQAYEEIVPAPPAPLPPPPPPAPTTFPSPSLKELLLSKGVTEELASGSIGNNASVRLILEFNFKESSAISAWCGSNYNMCMYYLGLPLPKLPDELQNGVDPVAFFTLLDMPAMNSITYTVNPNAGQRALLATNNSYAEAWTWLTTHGNDAGVNDPFPVPEPPPPPPPPPPPVPTTVTKRTSTTKFASRPVDGSGDWSVQDTPFNADKISITNGFVWISGESKMAFCGKPCTTGNWNIRDDNHELMGSGATSVYGLQPGETGMFKTDETAQTGWTPVDGFKDIKFGTFASEADNSVLWGSDANNTYRCEGTCATKDQLETVDSQGYVPINGKGSLSINPSTRNVWMASSTSSSGGNLFQRIDAPNSGAIYQNVDDNMNERDRTFNSLGDVYEVQTAKISSKLARQEAVKAAKQSLALTDVAGKTDNDIQVLKRKVDVAKSGSPNYSSKMIPLQILLFSLALVVCLYLLTGWLISHTILMGLSVVILGAGFGSAIYFSVTT